MSQGTSSEWTETKKALLDLKSLLKCTFCENDLVDPHGFEMCDHSFCRGCAYKLMERNDDCPECHQGLWKKSLRKDLKVLEVLELCNQLSLLIYQQKVQPKEKTDLVERDRLNAEDEGDSEAGTFIFSDNETASLSDVADDKCADDNNITELPNIAKTDGEETCFKSVEHDDEMIEIIQADEDKNKENEVDECEILSENPSSVRKNLASLLEEKDRGSDVDFQVVEKVEKTSEKKNSYKKLVSPIAIDIPSSIIDEEFKSAEHKLSIEINTGREDVDENIKIDNSQLHDKNTDKINSMDDNVDEKTDDNFIEDKIDDNFMNNKTDDKIDDNFMNNKTDDKIDDNFMDDKIELKEPAKILDEDDNCEENRNDINHINFSPKNPENKIDEVQNDSKSNVEFTEPIKFKRRTRKSRRKTKGKKQLNDHSNANLEEDFKRNENVSENIIDLFEIDSKNAKEEKEKNKTLPSEKLPSEKEKPPIDEYEFSISQEDAKMNDPLRFSGDSGLSSWKTNFKKPKLTYGKRKLHQKSTSALFAFSSAKYDDADDEHLLKKRKVDSRRTKSEGGIQSKVFGKKNPSKPKQVKKEVKVEKGAKNKSLSTKREAVDLDEDDVPLTTFIQPANNKRKKNLTKKNVKGETSLHTACIKGKLTEAKELLELGSDPNTKDYAGWTPLHEACNHGNVEITTLLLDHGAMMDMVAGEDNETPLHDAVTNNRIEVVRLLLGRGAPTDKQNRHGLLPKELCSTPEMTALFADTTLNTTKTTEELDCSIDHGKSVKVIVTTSLNRKEKAEMLRICLEIGGAEMVDEFHDSATHVVCGMEGTTTQRTLKYLHALLHGKWLLDYKWATESMKKKSWLKEADYEIAGSPGFSQNIPRKSRINCFKSLPPLFEGCSFYLSGGFNKILPREKIITFINEGGGKILLREPKTSEVDPLFSPDVTISMRRQNILSKDACAPVKIYHAKANSSQACCTQYIVYDAKSSPNHRQLFSPVLCTAPVSWLLDCVSSFEILDIREKHEESLQGSQPG